MFKTVSSWTASLHRNRKSLEAKNKRRSKRDTREENKNGERDNQEKNDKSQNKRKKSGMDAESIARLKIGQLSPTLGFLGLK